MPLFLARKDIRSKESMQVLAQDSLTKEGRASRIRGRLRISSLSGDLLINLLTIKEELILSGSLLSGDRLITEKERILPGDFMTKNRSNRMSIHGKSIHEKSAE